MRSCRQTRKQTYSICKIIRKVQHKIQFCIPLSPVKLRNEGELATFYYPIWWAIAAWPVDNFVKDNDFTGKTVIPFCTSASSGIGQSGSLLADMAGTGDWLDGGRFSANASDSEIQNWVKQLGYAE